MNKFEHLYDESKLKWYDLPGKKYKNSNEWSDFPESQFSVPRLTKMSQFFDFKTRPALTPYYSFWAPGICSTSHFCDPVLRFRINFKSCFMMLGRLADIPEVTRNDPGHFPETFPNFFPEFSQTSPGNFPKHFQDTWCSVREDFRDISGRFCRTCLGDFREMSRELFGTFAGDLPDISN